MKIEMDNPAEEADKLKQLLGFIGRTVDSHAQYTGRNVYETAQSTCIGGLPTYGLRIEPVHQVKAIREEALRLKKSVPNGTAFFGPVVSETDRLLMKWGYKSA